MKPPVYCRRCGKEIPDKKYTLPFCKNIEIDPVRDLLKESGILLKEGDGERAREFLESLQNVCLFQLYGEECAAVSPVLQSEDDDLTADIDELFEGLVSRSSPDTWLERLQLLDYD